MKNNSLIMKRTKINLRPFFSLVNIIIIVLAILPSIAFSQDKILSKKIVYEVDIMKPRIEQTKQKDSIVYDYIVDRRFWWQSIDAIMADIRLGKMNLMSFEHDTISYNNVVKNLKAAYKKQFNDSLSDKGVNKLLEEEIRAIRFEEEWTYNPETMLINKRVIGYNPLITKDSIMLVDVDKNDSELKPKQFFRFELGWIYPLGTPTLKDTLCIARNIHFTIPIYNPKPYHWWDSHLEAEYSVPYFESYIQKAEEGKIRVYAEPISTETYNKAEIIKRRQFEMKIALDNVDKAGNSSEKDTIIKGNYNSDNISNLRFGDEWFFDIKTKQFIKMANYVSPMVEIKGLDGSSRGLMPIYYIRRR